MKRPVKNLQLKIQSSTFELLKDYKEICGLSNLSEAIDKLAYYNLPAEKITDEEIKLALNEQPALDITPAQQAEPELFEIDSSIPVPKHNFHFHLTPTFSEKVRNTLKKMKVGDSIVVTGDGQRATTFNMAKKLNMSIRTLAFEGKGQNAKIRVWRSA